MKNLLLIFGLILLYGCGCKDNTFEPYINQLLEYCKAYDVNCDKVGLVSISFGDVPVGDAGVCNYSYPFGNIIISESHWNNYNDCEKEILILHEYGHCAFGYTDNYLQFTSKEINNIIAPEINMPQNIMFWGAMVTASFYCSNSIDKDYYLTDYFENL